MAPLIMELQQHQDIIETKVCVTAQHRQMLDQILDFFEIVPDFDLNVMKENQNLYDLSSSILSGLRPILEEAKPQYIFVHGDTTTTMVASLAGFYYGAKVCHVEAGLRTFNKYAPFPEEINRSITSRIADFHFAPTTLAKENLINESINTNSIIVTGNTVIDALLFSIKKAGSIENEEIELLKREVDFSRRVILVTGHRRENHGQGFINICEALLEIATLKPEVQIVYPVHLNPNVMKPVYDILGKSKNIKLLRPLNYPAFVWLMNRSHIIITDSGGIQEEAPSLGKPVLVMRETTERPEAVHAGTVILVGTDRKLIVKETLSLLENANRYKEMSELSNPYGDGNAASRIAKFLAELD